MKLTFILSILTSYILALLAIAFYTLLERKALGYFQIRKGPNKVSIIGLPQPFADAIKLFTKEQTAPTVSNTAPFLIAPILRLILALLLWSLAPVRNPAYFVKFGALAFLCISRLNIYTTLRAGWSSNSKYALLGAIRRIAQTVSYEVSMALILISPLFIIISLNISKIYLSQTIPISIILFPLFTSWFATILAETNRTPFDLAEGESELVSGFNIEYRRGNFALIFIAEYTRILIISIITTSFWMSPPLLPPTLINLSLSFTTISLAFLFIWVRATLPRIRYDQLISLTWKSFLPLALIFLLITPVIPLI